MYQRKHIDRFSRTVEPLHSHTTGTERRGCHSRRGRRRRCHSRRGRRRGRYIRRYPQTIRCPVIVATAARIQCQCQRVKWHVDRVGPFAITERRCVRFDYVVVHCQKERHTVATGGCVRAAHMDDSV